MQSLHPEKFTLRLANTVCQISLEAAHGDIFFTRYDSAFPIKFGAGHVHPIQDSAHLEQGGSFRTLNYFWLTIIKLQLCRTLRPLIEHLMGLCPY